MTFHDLRHTYATISIANGDDIKTVQENLGHATAAFTLDFYGHVTDSMRKRSTERMENFIQGLNWQKMDKGKQRENFQNGQGKILETIEISRIFIGGRYKTRTCDLPHVKRMRYQLRQSSIYRQRLL